MLVSLVALNRPIGTMNSELAISFFIPNELVRMRVGTKRDL